VEDADGDEAHSRRAYQIPGATERGASRPEQNLPPEGVPSPLEA
jgi:hypothetical protein